MKKRKLIFISGVLILILSQGALPYETILLDFTLLEKLPQVRREKISYTVKQERNSYMPKKEHSDGSVQFFSDIPKRKRDDFTLVEKNITLLQKQALSGDNSIGISEFGKIVIALSGKLVYGSDSIDFR